jgi:4a-hydroxytetrahydrobiopterin dehydratase
MPELAQQKCEVCTRESLRVTQEEMGELKTQIPQWMLIDPEGASRLQRTYNFPDFKSALTFTSELGAIAQVQKHHPVLLTEYGKVTVTWWSHVISGLHKNDFIMAAKTDQIAANCLARVLLSSQVR